MAAGIRSQGTSPGASTLCPLDRFIDASRSSRLLGSAYMSYKSFLWSDDYNE